MGFNLLLILKSNTFVKSNLQFHAMDDNIENRLTELRDVMRRERLDAFIFPSTDPHCGEYVPDHWKCREWVSGFGGSAGTAVVTLDAAALWTDSRYFIAAEEALRGTGYVLMRERVDGTPGVAEWIARKLAVSGGTAAGIDGMALARDLRSRGERTQIVFVTGIIDHALDGYDVDAVSYLLKPVRAEKLEAALDRALDRAGRDEPRAPHAHLLSRGARPRHAGHTRGRHAPRLDVWDCADGGGALSVVRPLFQDPPLLSRESPARAPHHAA